MQTPKQQVARVARARHETNTDTFDCAAIVGRNLVVALLYPHHVSVGLLLWRVLFQRDLAG
jgi:hypothetical protein